MLSIYSRTPSFHPLLSLLPSCQIFRQTGQKGAKVNDFLGALGVFSGFSETERDKNQTFIWKVVQDVGQVVQDVRALAAFRGLPLVQVVGAALAILLTSAKMDKIPSFCPLSCFASGVLAANMPLFRIIRGFDGVLWVSCGFVLLWCFAWLVGLLCACGVRRLYDLRRVCSYLSLYLPFYFSLCIAFCPLFFFALVVFACPLALSFLSCFVFVVSFSLSDYTQKERARRVGASSLVLLWDCYIRINSSK